jgi:hypothetical protein
MIEARHTDWRGTVAVGDAAESGRLDVGALEKVLEASAREA